MSFLKAFFGAPGSGVDAGGEEPADVRRCVELLRSVERGEMVLEALVKIFEDDKKVDLREKIAESIVLSGKESEGGKQDPVHVLALELEGGRVKADQVVRILSNEWAVEIARTFERDDVAKVVENGDVKLVEAVVDVHSDWIDLEMLTKRAGSDSRFLKALVSHLSKSSERRSEFISSKLVRNVENAIKAENEDALALVGLILDNNEADTQIQDILLNLLVSDHQNKRVIELSMTMLEKDPDVLTNRLNELISLYEVDDEFPLLELLRVYLSGNPENGEKLASAIASYGTFSDAVIDLASFCVLTFEETKNKLENLFVHVLESVNESGYSGLRFLVTMSWKSHYFSEKVVRSQMLTRVLGYLMTSSVQDDIRALIYFLLAVILLENLEITSSFDVFDLAIDEKKLLKALNHVEVDEGSKFGILQNLILSRVGALGKKNDEHLKQNYKEPKEFHGDGVKSDVDREDQARTELESSLKMMAKLKEEITTKTTECSNLQASLAMLHEEIATIKAENQSLRDKEKKMENLLQIRDNEVRTWKEHDSNEINASIERENADLKKKITTVDQELRNRIRQLESEKQKMAKKFEDQHEKSRSEILKLQKQIKFSKDQAHEIKNRAEVARQEAKSRQTELETQIDSLKTEISQKDTEIKELHQKLQTQESIPDFDDSKQREMEQKIKTMSQKIEDLTTKLEEQKHTKDAPSDFLTETGICTQAVDHEKQLKAQQSMLSQIQQEYSDSLNELRAQNSAITKREMETRDELAKLAEEKETLIQTITELNISVSSGYEQKGFLVLERESLLERESELKLVLAQKDEEIEEKDRHISELVDRNRRMEDQLSILEQKVGSITKRIDKTTKHNNSSDTHLLKRASLYKRKVKELRSKVKEKDSEIAELKREHEKQRQDLLTELAIHKCKAQDVSDRLAASFRDKFRAAKHENQVLMEKYEELKMETESLRDRVKFLDERNEWKNKEITALKEESKAQSDEMSAKIQKQKGKISELKQEMEKQRETSTSQTQPLTSPDSSNRELRIKLIKANESNKRLRAKAAKLENELTHSQLQKPSPSANENDSLRLTILKLKEERREMRREIQRLKKTTTTSIDDELKRMGEEKRRMKAQFESQLDDLDSQIEHLSRDTFDHARLLKRTFV